MDKKVNEKLAIDIAKLIDRYEDFKNDELIGDLLYGIIMNREDGALEDALLYHLPEFTVIKIKKSLRLLCNRNVIIRFKKEGYTYYKINNEYFIDKPEYNNIKKYFN